MTASPARMPTTRGASSARPSGPRIAGKSCHTTWAIAPAPTPSRKDTTLGLNAAAPIHAPRIAGAPAIRPSTASRRSPGGRSASGATIASPSVVLWIANPTTRKLPSASAPIADAEPIANPPPRVWAPLPLPAERGGGPAARDPGADPQPPAEVVQPDPDRDEEREVGPRRALRPRPLLAAHVGVDGGAREGGAKRS